jgi:HK97 gp10 family phage protein
MGSFSIKGGAAEINSVIERYYKIKDKADLAMLSKMKYAINQLVYKTARARRPKISIQEHVALGRPKKVNGRPAYRVSDPNATLGVPVRSGNLQISILKEVKQTNGKVQGRVYIKGPGQKYAKYIEFGTSRMRARPFMRPALNLNLKAIRKRFLDNGINEKNEPDS